MIAILSNGTIEEIDSPGDALAFIGNGVHLDAIVKRTANANVTWQHVLDLRNEHANAHAASAAVNALIEHAAKPPGQPS